MAALLGMLLLVTSGARAAGESLITAPRVERAPTVDGVLAPGEWDAAAVTCGFRDLSTGYPARATVTVAACYDQQALYLLLVNAGEDPAKLVGGLRERDAAIWGDSEVEVFLAPEGWTVDRYLQVAVNHAGSRADSRWQAGAADTGWNPESQVATGQREGAWVAEMALPWAALEIATPGPGTTLRANFARNAASRGEYSTWAALKLGGGFLQPERFGALVLGGSGPAVAIDQLPGRRQGASELRARLTLADPRARLSVRLSDAQGRPGREYVADFRPAGAGDPTAVVAWDTPPGTRALEVMARAASGQPLWSQSVALDLPDVPDRLRQVRAALAALPAVALSREERSALGRRLAELGARAAGEREAAELALTEAEVARVGTQVHDLALVAEAARRTGRGPGEAPPLLLTCPEVTRKIQPDAVDPGPLATELRLAMARGEYEPAQLVVSALRADLRRVRVTAGQLTGPGGHVIPAERVEVNPLGFITITKASPGGRLLGPVPDVLLSNRAMTVLAGRRQPFFVTVQTTAQDPAGNYQGAVWVRAEGAAPVRVPLAVRVFEVTLPVRSHLRTAFLLWGTYYPPAPHFPERGAPDYLEVFLRYSRAMLAHRLSPITFWDPQRDAGGNWDFSREDRYLAELVPQGLTTFNVSGFNSSVVFQGNTEYLQAISAHLKAKGWWDIAYAYGRDEAPQDAANWLRDCYRPLVEAVPDLKIMQTGWMPDPALQSLVRIWCPLSSQADGRDAALRAARAAGDETWWYICVAPPAPYANLWIDYPGVDHRLLGWQTYQHGIQGFLYWGVDVWPPQAAPEELDRTNYADWDPLWPVAPYNGEGQLLYPGPNYTPVSSLRLALLRDGFEDYDLFKEVEALAAAHPGPEAEQTKRLLNFDDLSPSLTEFTPDGNLLLARREALLQVAEELAEGARAVSRASDPRVARQR